MLALLSISQRENQPTSHSGTFGHLDPICQRSILHRGGWSMTWGGFFSWVMAIKCYQVTLMALQHTTGHHSRSADAPHRVCPHIFWTSCCRPCLQLLYGPICLHSTLSTMTMSRKVWRTKRQRMTHSFHFYLLWHISIHLNLIFNERKTGFESLKWMFVLFTPLCGTQLINYSCWGCSEKRSVQSAVKDD